MRVTDLCHEMHRQGGALVAAHPFRGGQNFDEILKDLRPTLDGIELMSGRMDAACRQRAARVFRSDQWVGLASSDAHHENSLGCCTTQFDVPIRNNRDLVAAIRRRRAAPAEILPLAAS